MHARTNLALALAFAFIAGPLQAAAPWERADSKIQGYNADQVRRSTRAYSYTPRAATTTAPPVAVQRPAIQTPASTQAAVAAQAPVTRQTPVPATRPMQTLAPRTQPAPITTVPPTSVVPRSRGATLPATNNAPPQTRGYRSYSYQPEPSYGYRRNTRMRSNRVPFYMRADSKVLGREGM